MRAFKPGLIASLYALFMTPVFAGAMLQDMSNPPFSFSELHGKWVFINYWASWCHPCVDEIPELNRFYDENKNKNVALFAVNYDGIPLSKQKQLIQQFGIHYPSLQQDPANALELGEIRGVPVTFVFNPQGELSDALYGPQSVRTLQRIIRTSTDHHFKG